MYRLFYKEREGCGDCFETTSCAHKLETPATYRPQARRELGLNGEEK
jgi:hypothetical protein